MTGKKRINRLTPGTVLKFSMKAPVNTGFEGEVPPPWWIKRIPLLLEVWESPIFQFNFKQRVLKSAKSFGFGLVTALIIMGFGKAIFHISGLSTFNLFAVALVGLWIEIVYALIRLSGVIFIRTPVLVFSILNPTKPDLILTLPIPDRKLFQAIALTPILCAYRVIEDIFYFGLAISAATLVLGVAAIKFPSKSGGVYPVGFDTLILLPTSLLWFILALILFAFIATAAISGQATRYPPFIASVLGLFPICLMILLFSFVFAWGSEFDGYLWNDVGKIIILSFLAIPLTLTILAISVRAFLDFGVSSFADARRPGSFGPMKLTSTGLNYDFGEK